MTPCRLVNNVAVGMV